MNIRYLVAPAALLLAACQPTSPASTNDAEVALEDDATKFSYAAGYEIGQRLSSMGGIEISSDAMMTGLDDALAEKDARLDAEEMNAVKSRVYQAAAEKRNAERDAKAEEATERGAQFLEENKAKEGVQVTESGLQYIIETAGEGEAPTATDTVTVHYKGTLIDGTEFDSSYKRNQPAKFRLNGVIKGWTEGLQLMVVGEKTRFWIPKELAYNDRPGKPAGMLVFDVELIEIGAAQPANPHGARPVAPPKPKAPPKPAAKPTP